MKPTTGRTVHYVLDVGEGCTGCHRAATITSAEPAELYADFDDRKGGVTSKQSTESLKREEVNLLVWKDVHDGEGPGPLVKRMVPHDEDHAPGSWHWPEQAADTAAESRVPYSAKPTP